MATIAESVKRARKSRGLSQEQMAGVLDVSRNYITQIETGRKRPSLALLTKISTVTETTLDSLISADPTIVELRNQFGARAASILGALRGDQA